MGGEDGGPGDLEHVGDRLVGDVGDIHEHPQSVHLEHDLPAEVGQSVVHRVFLRVEARTTRRIPEESAQSFVFVCVSVM